MTLLLYSLNSSLSIDTFNFFRKICHKNLNFTKNFCFRKKHLYNSLLSHKKVIEYNEDID